MSPPSTTVHKTHTLNIPLLVALLLTSAIHFLLIAQLKPALFKFTSPQKIVTITLVKAKKIKPKSVVKMPEALRKKPVAIPAPVSPVKKNILTTAVKVKHRKPPQKTSAPPALRTDFSMPPETVIKPAAIIEPKFEASVPAAKPVETPSPVVPETEPVAKMTENPIPEATVPITNPPEEAINPAKELTTNWPAEKPAIAVVEPAQEVEKTTAPASLPHAVAVDNLPISPVKSAKKAIKKSRKSQSQSANFDHNTPPLSLDDLALQVAQVGEKFGSQPEFNSASRVKAVTAVQKHKVSARQYILDWQHKVERVGNLNYPEVARQKDFSAHLVMEVAINSDGSIHSLHIKKSSGTLALDEAAKNIVQMASPFAALPKDLAEELDVLRIQRTWQFSDESMTTQ